LKRAFGIGNEREATIAITTSIAKVSTALVFVISTQWKSSSAELIKRQFALTNTETEVLISFVNGYSSKDIAKQRKRSHATVRTQFQTILAKTGARNQSELLRICLSVSDFVGKIDVITDAVNHPHRRRSEVLRKGGRRVEVTIAGDVSGDPIVSIAQLTHYTFTAEFEQYLFDAKLYIINVCPPSYGRTDPIAENASRIDHTCDDVIAVLDQLEVDSCPVLATHTNGPYVYALANSRPERINSVAQISAIGPIKFAQNSESCSSWMTGIVRACHTHGALKRIIIRGAVRSMVTLGSKQFMRIQVTSKPIDAEYVLRPENIKEYQHAMTAATHGGLASAVTDCILAFGDWTDHIESMNQHITIIHGGEDGLFAIESVRAFAAEFPDKVTVIEISEAGFSLAYSHAKEAVAILRSLVDKQQLNDLPVS